MVCASTTQIDLPKSVLGILRPPERLTVSEWADKNRYLSRKFAATPGRWKTAHTPYLREILDSYTEASVQQIVFMKCSRVGGTEFLNNVLAYTLDARPVPTMYVQPEKSAVQDEFTGRLRTMIEDSPRLSDHIVSRHWCKPTRINLATCDVYGAWAENPRTMIRLTIGLAIFDEIDNCAEAAGGLGNTLELLGERIVTFGFRGKIIANGTPTTAEASGWKLLEASDYRRPYVPCPKCGQYQVMVFSQIKLMAGHEEERSADAIEQQQLAGYQCKHCEEILPHSKYHRWMIDRVVWIPRGQEPAEPLDVHNAKLVSQAMACGEAGRQQWRPKLEGDPPTTKIRGYWINVLYSPWSGRTWSDIFARFLRVKGDRDKLRVFTNAWLGEPWREAVEATRVDFLLARRKESTYQMGYVSSQAKILLMGADVQLDHMYYVIRAWGPGETSWLVHHGTVETFDALYDLAFFKGFPVLGHPGRLMRCEALAIDSGYRTDEVYDFGRKPGVMVCKGVTQAIYRTRASSIEWQPKGSRGVQSVQLHSVNTSLFKTKVHRLAKLDLDQPGAWYLPRDCDVEYIQQFASEHQVWRRPKGKRAGSAAQLVWETRTQGAANHYLDCDVYGAALADIRQVPLMRELTPAMGVMEEPKPTKIIKPAGRGGGGNVEGGYF